jgi:hypothetical protein
MTRFISFTIHLILFGLLIRENNSEACGMYGADEIHLGKVGIGDRVVLQWINNMQ